uniref:Uncharacterized protein n=1 Tax=Populus trichocarpa TaxID=3694 RepID=A9P9T6_POPTR|nr:unknown [Populus trichocarpa]
MMRILRKMVIQMWRMRICSSMRKLGTVILQRKTRNHLTMLLLLHWLSPGVIQFEKMEK